MPFSQIEMPVNSKPGRSLINSKYSTYDTIGSSAIVRPLGLVRNAHQTQPDEEEDDNYSLDFNDSESSASRNSEGSFREEASNNENAVPTEDFLQQNNDKTVQDERTRQQVFKSRLNITGTRKRPPPKQQKPSQLTNKKVIQLPMLKLNLESLTGAKNNEDTKTLETTRRSLKTLIDDGKKAVKRTDIDTNQFMTPADKNKDQSFSSQGDNKSSIVQTSTKRNHSPGKQSPLILPPTVSDSVHVLTTSSRKASSSSYGNKDAITSVAFSNAVCELDSESVTEAACLTYRDNHIQYSSSRYKPEIGCDLMIDSVHRPTSSTRAAPVTLYDMAAWPSYEEVSNLRKDSNHGCSKHEYLLKKHRFQQELLEQRIQARRDQSRSWVNINSNGYKASPILRYTTYQGTKLEPINVPTHAKDHCPMCNLYKANKVSTACPPNSPKETHAEASFFLAPMNDDDLRINQDENTEGQFASAGTSTTEHFKDITKLEPMTSSRVAKTRGFRGSKTPIAFSLGYNFKATS
ncbi:hypothetical protein SNE40_018950 [Patella caerulea]|uniref:Uncharacterized protein n=1 Tax=Patella caerulea TaxID=87958 RepID=A0AAN8PDQ4_PATCE